MPLRVGLTVSTCVLCTSLALQTSNTHACTTFASVGTANNEGGLIMAKNRDSLAAFEQLEVKREPDENAYLGLFYNTTDRTPFPYIAAGINQFGLSVVQNESASINDASKFNDGDQSDAIYNILKRYRSVAEVLADQEALFGNGLANFLIIGDKTEAILVEVGPVKGSYEILKASQNQNRLYHTNHYVLEPMRKFNKVFYPDSEDRFETIKALMKNAPGQLTAEGNYYRWMNSAQNGPYNSILREVTVASWVVTLPEGNNPELNLRFTSPSQTFQRYEVELTPEFWNYPPEHLLPLPLNADGIESEPVGSERRYTYTEGEL